MGPKIPYLGIFWLQFNKSYYQIFNQHPQIFENIKFHPKQKNYSWDQKGFIWVFWAAVLKNYCHIWNQHPPFCLIAKFGAKNENPFIWDQRCQICVFWDRIWTYYCHTWNWHPWICLIPKLREIMKMLKFGTKNPLFGFFWGDQNFQKKYSHIWNQHPQICLIVNKNVKILDKKLPYFGILRVKFEKTVVIFEISTLEFV